jgi:hypothetical protein
VGIPVPMDQAVHLESLRSLPCRRNDSRTDSDTVVIHRARETYNIVSPDEYAEVGELAPPQKEFELYSESHRKRVK